MIALINPSYSLPLAVSKMVSAKAQLGQWRNVKRVFICAIAFAIGIGTTFGLIVLIGAQFFTRVFFHSELAAIALRFMAPTILIMALLGVFRGFFQGLQNTLPTAAASGIMGIVCFGCYQLLYQFLGKAIPMLISVVVAVVVYFAVAVKCKLLTESVMRDLPKGSMLIRIAKKCRLM